MRIVFMAVGEDFGTLDMWSYWLPLFSATCIMVVIFVAFLKLLRIRRQYNIELNMTQVLIANLYMLTYLLTSILMVVIHMLSGSLNKDYSS